MQRYEDAPGAYPERRGVAFGVTDGVSLKLSRERVVEAFRYFFEAIPSVEIQAHTNLLEPFCVKAYAHTHTHTDKHLPSVRSREREKGESSRAEWLAESVSFLCMLPTSQCTMQLDAAETLCI